MSTCSFNKLCRAVAITCTAALMGVGLAPPAFASVVSDNSLFELDRPNVPDTVDPNCSGASNTFPCLPPSALPDDWNNFGPNGSNSDTVKKGSSHADVFTGIITDTTPHVFSKGSKDEDDVSKWDFRSGSSPAKADMTHAYAAGYNHNTSGANIPLVLFFGSNRSSFNGTTELGYWFFKNKVVLDETTGTFKNADGTGPAHHCNNDLLVTVAYDNGGKIGTIRVRKWSDTSGDPCDGTGTLVDVTNSTNTSGISGRFCDVSGTGNPGADTVCAGSNSTTITLPWAPGEGGSGQFLEGGLDVAALTGEDKPCFASFMATSRSSSTTKSETKNFILRDFPVCKLDVTKTCVFKELVSQNQARFTVKGQVTNSGGGTLANITVTDVPALESGSTGFFTCSGGLPTTTSKDPASLVPGDTICYSATILGGTGVQTFEDTITAHGTSSGATISSNGATATCTVQFEGFPTISKSCTTCLNDTDTANRVVLDVSYGGSLCNTNNFAFTNVTIKDLAEGTDSAASTAGIVIAGGLTNGSFTLGAGTEADPTCVNYTGTYKPHHALNKLLSSGNTLNPDVAQLRDTISATGTRPFGTADELLVSTPKSCNLCLNPDNPPARCGFTPNL
ncbi:hypothetical protein [Pseudogulbenkiania sp. MAI-1]|uniref:hypothetical protein n=1 Tax=Pseudogulbenkiania sp. MAI-1 TaxID=990370 RepID=UPI0004AEF216|nr:hypothetical protein [Pseudogulbenkiania sp. MAI-1]